jgi:NADPH-dependent F420 reductase
MNISIIGGTGDMGFGLAVRFLLASHSVTIGSRVPERAVEAAKRAGKMAGSENVAGTDNQSAAERGEIVIIAVPTAGHRATVESLKKTLVRSLVIDITIPMAFKPLRYNPPAEGSNARESEAILGSGCRLVAGFHTVSAKLLENVDVPLTGDTLIVGDDKESKAIAADLAKSIGLGAYDAGSLLFSPIVEGLTPMLIGMNKRYGSDHIGIKLEGF